MLLLGGGEEADWDFQSSESESSHGSAMACGSGGESMSGEVVSTRACVEEESGGVTNV